MNKFFLEYAAEYFGDREIIGCEVGVNRADHALQLLQRLNLSKLYLVDPYPMPRTDPYTEQDKEIARVKLSKYFSKTEWIFQYSTAATRQIQEELDFVYIDASHDYYDIRDDIQAYWRLVKPEEGILGGHDYYIGTVRLDLMGVKLAVDEFVAQNNLKLFVSNKKRKGEYDWWIVK